MTAASDHTTDSYRPEPGPAYARPRQLFRSRTNRVFAGVCGGIAEHYGADASAVRLLTVVIALFTALVPMFVLYLVAAVVIPERVDGEELTGQAAPTIAPGQATIVFGVLLVAVGLLALGNQLLRIDWDLLWPVLLIVGGGALIVGIGRR